MIDATCRQLAPGDLVFCCESDGQLIKLFFARPHHHALGEDRYYSWFSHDPIDLESVVSFHGYSHLWPTAQAAIADRIGQHHEAIARLTRRLHA